MSIRRDFECFEVARVDVLCSHEFPEKISIRDKYGAEIRIESSQGKSYFASSTVKALKKLKGVKVEALVIMESLPGLRGGFYLYTDSRTIQIELEAESLPVEVPRVYLNGECV